MAKLTMAMWKFTMSCTIGKVTLALKLVTFNKLLTHKFTTNSLTQCMKPSPHADPVCLNADPRAFASMQYDVNDNIMMFMNLTLFITCVNSPKPSVQGVLPAQESKGVTHSYPNKRNRRS